MIQTRSVLPTVIVVAIAGVLTVILLAGQTKGEHFVISGSLDISVARSPIEGAVHDRWSIEYRAAAGEVPKDISVCRVQRVHLSGIRAGIHDAVCNTDRTSVNGVDRGVCGLPKDLPSGDIESAPCTPGYLLSRGHQGVGEMVAIRDSNINALTVGGGTPLDAPKRCAWPHRCTPDDVTVIRIKCPEDAALLAKADNVTHQIGSRPTKVKIWAAGYRTVRVRSRGELAC